MFLRLPKSLFGYLHVKFQSIIEQEKSKIYLTYSSKKKQDTTQKDKHLRLFRPNLSNPANKELTKELNDSEIKRTEEYKEFIDDIQMEMLEKIEE